LIPTFALLLEEANIAAALEYAVRQSDRLSR
jgi:hypothetical protein